MREVPVAAHEAGPRVRARGAGERDLSVEGVSGLEAVSRESGGQGKGPGFFGQTRCYSGGERGSDRGRK